MANSARTSRSQGVHGTGAIDVTPAQKEAIVRALKEYEGNHRRVTVEKLSEITGIGGRTIRACVAEIDGVELLVGSDDDGMFVASYADDAEPFTRRLFSQARKMLGRAERRRVFADKQLPARQRGLF